MSLSCPHCGGAISVQVHVQLPTNSGANAEANGQIAHGSELQGLAVQDLSQELAPKGRKRYNQGYDQEFLRFWQEYPIHRNKRQAYKAWDSALRRMLANPGAKITSSQSAILAGAIRYRQDPNRVDEYTQHAATWLNGDGWEDDPLPFRLKPQDARRPDPPRPMTSGDMAIFMEIERSRDA